LAHFAPCDFNDLEPLMVAVLNLEPVVICDFMEHQARIFENGIFVFLDRDLDAE
jgi:hypothetical protein